MIGCFSTVATSQGRSEYMTALAFKRAASAALGCVSLLLHDFGLSANSLESFSQQPHLQRSDDDQQTTENPISPIYPVSFGSEYCHGGSLLITTECSELLPPCRFPSP